jgi:hypothetical protein
LPGPGALAWLGFEEAMMSNPTHKDDDEILRGCEKIAEAIQENERRTYTLMVKKILPCWKELGVWTTTRGRLRHHYFGETLNENPAAEQAAGPGGFRSSGHSCRAGSTK